MSVESVVYLDSSALVKLVVGEPESGALRHFLADRTQRVSSALARVEVLRAVRPHGPVAVARGEQVVQRIDLLQIDDPLLRTAATLGGPTLRSLDAIHLAAALTFQDVLSEVVTYDHRMAEAAAALSLPVAAPQ